MKLARRLAHTVPFADFIQQEIHPGPNVQTDEQLSTALDAGLTAYYHGCGSAPMGDDRDPTAVVDGQGRVRQVHGLRVVDTSIFPEAISPPITLTVLMVAERITAAMS